MPFFRVEVMDIKGKIVEMRHVELDCKTVGQACNSAKVNKLKKDARYMGFGFRVKLEEEK